MFTPLPKTSDAFSKMAWTEIEPWYRELTSITLSSDTLKAWLAQWSDLSALVDETLVRFEIATTTNVDDKEVAERKQHFLEDVHVPIQAADQQVKEQLVASGLQPDGFAIPLRNMRAEISLYKASNLPLLAEDRTLSDAYYEVTGSQQVTWEGKEVSVSEIYSILYDPDRARREAAWHALSTRQLQDRQVLNDIWGKKIGLRQQIAHNAGFDSFRDYRWLQLHRFDYTPDDCKTFHAAVEQVIVPAARQIRAKHRQMLGVESLRPWDIYVNPRASETPRAITDVSKLLQQCIPVFRLINPQLQGYFEIMLQEHLLDLEERPAKAPGGYNLPLEVVRRPFIFGHVNSIGAVVPLIFHEMGHAFHVFETIPLRYLPQRGEQSMPMEFMEVASTSMEFIGALHLHRSGLFSQQEEVLTRIQQLEDVLTSLLPLTIQGDAFQHWVYEHPEEAQDPNRVDAKWAELGRRFLPDIDWSGFEDALNTGWQNILHYFTDPFYFIEYAFAAIGALQVWRNYLQDPQTALQQYRHALSLGATRPLPELFQTAGADFNFGTDMLQNLTQLLLQTIDEIEAQ